MSVAITVRDVSKRYRIGLAEERSETFAGQIIDMVKAPLRNLKQLRSLSRFKGEDESVFWALRDISFDVKEGEVLGIIGHNGAGKSTLLKILSRITEPTSGEITINGRVSSLLEVGTGFHPDLTGRENIYMNGTILGMKKREIDSKLEEIITFSGVSKYIDTPVKRYSSGMKVRLAFSVAAHLEPEVLIIDEVLAVGDAEFQKKCLGKMKEVSGEGRTILFVSHNMLAIKSLCSRGISLDKGTIRENGDIENVINSYLSNTSQFLVSEVKIERKEKGFIIHSLRIYDNGINGKFNIEDDLIIEVIASAEADFEAININLFFNTTDGIVVFATCSQAEKFEQGRYRFQCIIPKGTLNDNIYALDLMVVDKGPKIIHHLKDVLSIEGVEVKRDGAWLGKYPGMLRPQYFKWIKTDI